MMSKGVGSVADDGHSPPVHQFRVEMSTCACMGRIRVN